MLQEEELKPEILPENQVQPYIQELFRHEQFTNGMQAFLPEALVRLIFQKKDGIHDITAFQSELIYPVMKAIEKGSAATVSVSGIEHLDSSRQYLFISNHRDIVLDSAFLNTVLFERGFRTSQIAIGDNLMKHRISEIIFKLNKSFVVKRSGSPIELYRYSVMLAEHIRRQIVEKRDSIWIAQREGRAKDGNDRTQTGLLKMFSLGHEGDLIAHFKSLSIVPVAISYEYDPCDLLKTQEYLNQLQNPDYKKSFEEDVQHMILGLKGYKGKIHFHFDKPLQEQLDVLQDIPGSKKQLDALAEMIDRSIHKNYKLHGINEIAWKLLNSDSSPCHLCDADEEQKLSTYFTEKAARLQGDAEGKGRNYLLAMYANPLVNQRNISAGE